MKQVRFWGWIYVVQIRWERLQFVTLVLVCSQEISLPPFFARFDKLTGIISNMRHFEALIDIGRLARSAYIDMTTFNFMYGAGRSGLGSCGWVYQTCEAVMMVALYTLFAGRTMTAARFAANPVDLQNNMNRKPNVPKCSVG